MSRNLVLSITRLIKNLESVFLAHSYPPPALALAGFEHQHRGSGAGSQNFSLKQLLGDGILWAVPKHRRTVEKRLNRKFGHPEYVWKPLKVKQNLRTCQQCGHDHEVGILCPHCYDNVRKETQLMQDKIQADLGLEPVDQEVIVLYQGEKGEQSADAFKGKRIVEMEKPRPMWFTKNLLQKSTQQESETKEVKPTDLG